MLVGSSKTIAGIKTINRKDPRGVYGFLVERGQVIALHHLRSTEKPLCNFGSIFSSCEGSRKDSLGLTAGGGGCLWMPRCWAEQQPEPAWRRRRVEAFITSNNLRQSKKTTAIHRHETGHIECIDICKKAKGRGVGSISNVSNLKVGRQAQMRADLGCHSGLCKNTG
jgi:hypothetical protein